MYYSIYSSKMTRKLKTYEYGKCMPKRQENSKSNIVVLSHYHAKPRGTNIYPK